MYFDDEDFD